MGHTASGTELTLFPRYPLMGQWKVPFYYGYSLETTSFLFAEGSKFGLKIPLTPALDFPIDEFELKIILPEGSSDIKVQS